MTVSKSRGRERKLRSEGTEKKRESKKDWTKKKNDGEGLPTEFKQMKKEILGK